MSKLSKLKSHPKLFFKDFFLNRIGNSNSAMARKSLSSKTDEMVVAVEEKFSLIVTQLMAKADSTNDPLALFFELEQEFEILIKVKYGDAEIYLLDENRISLFVSFLSLLAKNIDLKIRIDNGGFPILCLGGDKSSVVLAAIKKAQTISVFLEHEKTNNSFQCEITRTIGPVCEAKARNVDLKKMIVASQAKPISKLANVASNFSPSFPIDFVYTWVNGADENWREMIGQFAASKEIDWDRYTDNEELRYSLRSVFMHASWFRKIFIVSNCEKPAYVGDNEEIVWVDHREIMDGYALPTFNSHVIESYLWKINGLSENFVYMNDDVFLSHYIQPQVLHSPNGCSVSHMEPYGMVNHFAEKIEFDLPLETWEQAALAGALLIEKKFGVFPVQLHRHSPHSLKKSVLEQMEAELPEEFRLLRQQRFRSEKDISPVSFLYHHYAYHMKEAVRSERESIIIRHNNYRAAQRRITQDNSNIDFFCLNDGGGSYKNKAFQKFKTEFLEKMFPVKFPGEQDGTIE